MTPITSSFLYKKPMEMHAKGKPCTKFVVPSVGALRSTGRISETGGNIPIGSTQNVGASVKGGRVPSVYDSSPILIRPNVKDGYIVGRGQRGEARNAQLELWAIRGRDLVH